VTENEVAKQVVDAAYHVPTSLGPGLLESVYELVLAYELEKRGLRTLRQRAVPIVYQGIRMEIGFRADLIVEDLVIGEIQSVETVVPVHQKQLLTHLRLAEKRLALLINFNVALIKEGIIRIVNGLPDGSPAHDAKFGLRPFHAARFNWAMLVSYIVRIALIASRPVGVSG
jgi:GxxExxY protein